MPGQADCPHTDFFGSEGNWVCRACGKVLASMNASRVTDASGTRWVTYEKRKRRKPARALRFANIKEGDILMCARYPNELADDRGAELPTEKWTRYLVTDLWFDPVAGERDQTAGLMVAIRMLRNGQPLGSKRPHTRRGLAMQGYHYADKLIAAREELAESISAQLEAIRAKA